MRPQCQEDTSTARSPSPSDKHPNCSRLLSQPAPPSRRLQHYRRWIAPTLAIVLLGYMAIAMITAARQQSPTFDEPAYVGAAATYLEHRSLQLNFEHPPLAKLATAIGLSFHDINLGHFEKYENIKHVFSAQTAYTVGKHVLYGPGHDANRILFLARLPMILLTLAFGLVVFAFAKDLFGLTAGLFALGLYAFSPDIIAHGSLATNDVPVAGFLLTTVWLLWRSQNAPMPYLLLAGVAFGCALATKMTALLATPVVLF